MAKIVELPRLSDTMEEGVIATWHVALGDKVKRGQLIAEIETDKATMEFESFDAGIVLRLVAAEGDALPIGAAIAVLGKPGEDIDAALAAHGGAGGGGADATPPAPVAEAEPTAVATPPPASAAAAPSPSTGPQVAGRVPDRIAASPLARRLARERGIDLTTVSGTGPHGRIVKSDVDAAEASPAAAAPMVAVGTEVDERGRPFVGGPDQPQRLSQMRKTIARRMAKANAEIPHFYLTTIVDMDAAVTLREQLKAALPTKVSYNDMVLMAAARALVTHPEVNAYWDGQTIVQRGSVHVGMAVAVDEGLIVPVVRHTDQRTLQQIAVLTRDLGTRGRDKKLTPTEMSGSTFTVSNLGMFGIDEFSAVINPGEGAILAVGAIADTVVARGGEFAVAKRMKMTLACDHRVMDGAVGAKFLATMRGLLEQPLAMLA
ncbi:MAG: 2-oxo acid dehydrogenase subunit E2 [Deltaproteobacteria bacterium]|nr:2-oxo acid dehydrogenase subunit E2 [Deltaproteobacteria bacterium]